MFAVLSCRGKEKVMPTKAELQANALLDRGMKRTQDPETQRFRVEDNGVDKTPLMLYTEGVIGERIETILLKQMSGHRLAEWLTHELGRSITQATISKWRNKFRIIRVRRH